MADNEETRMREARDIVDSLYAMGPGLTMNDRYRYVASCLEEVSHRKADRQSKSELVDIPPCSALVVGDVVFVSKEDGGIMIAAVGATAPFPRVSKGQAMKLLTWLSNHLEGNQ